MVPDDLLFSSNKFNLQPLVISNWPPCTTSECSVFRSCPWIVCCFHLKLFIIGKWSFYATDAPITLANRHALIYISSCKQTKNINVSGFPLNASDCSFLSSVRTAYTWTWYICKNKKKTVEREKNPLCFYIEIHEHMYVENKHGQLKYLQQVIVVITIYNRFGN